MLHKIMVVDDDPSVRFAVEAVLEAADLSAVSVPSGEACIDKVQAGFRGLILMDVMMPNLDGFQTVAGLLDRGLMNGNLVCMLTAVQDPGCEMEPVKDCILDYVRKPFAPDSLVSTVYQHLAFLA